jgi:truncated hemoglobin YjbI
MDETEYTRGQRAAWLTILAEAVRQLGIKDTAAAHAAWMQERSDAVAALRRLCGEHGDNDWPDEMHLGDVIEKHLGRHLS